MTKLFQCIFFTFIIFNSGCISTQIHSDLRQEVLMDSILYTTKNFNILYSEAEDGIFLTDLRTKKSLTLDAYNIKYGTMPSNFHIQQNDKNDFYFFMTNYETIHGYYDVDVYLYMMKHNRLFPIKISYKGLNTENILSLNYEHIKSFRYEGQFFYKRRKLLFHLKSIITDKQNQEYIFNHIFINVNKNSKEIHLEPLIP